MDFNGYLKDLVPVFIAIPSFFKCNEPIIPAWKDVTTGKYYTAGDKLLIKWGVTAEVPRTHHGKK